MIEIDGEEFVFVVLQRNSFVGLEMYFLLGFSKKIFGIFRKIIRNFGNICYVKSLKFGISKYLIMGRKVLFQK